LPEEAILNKIYIIRNQKVMLDSDLAERDKLETKRVNEQIKRNKERFPRDFIFQLTKDEWEKVKSQIATSRWGGRRTLPYVFKEYSVLMLSSVLISPRAIEVMRVYTKMRELMISNKDLLLQLEEIKKNISSQDQIIDIVFDYLTKFITHEEEKQPILKVGFKSANKP
jgi:hypothetical protein